VEPVTTNGYTYLAHFSYNNPNTSTIMVPVGGDNNITTTGSYSGQLPVIFPPGTGHFNVYFNGQKMQWNLTTYNGTQKTAIASVASSTSARCTSQTVTTYRTSDVREAEVIPNKPGVYPNPAHNTAKLFVGNTTVSLKDIVVIDLSGRVFSSVGMKQSSTQIVELDLTPLRNGIYFIKANIDGQTKLFKLEKF
jgi:hypothetical protein